MSFMEKQSTLPAYNTSGAPRNRRPAVIAVKIPVFFMEWLPI